MVIYLKNQKSLEKMKETNIDILLLIGPYGPYLQLGTQDEDAKIKPKRVTIPPNNSLS